MSSISNFISSMFANQSIKSFCIGHQFGCAAFGDGKAKCWGHGLAFGSEADYIGNNLNELGSNLNYINLGSMTSISSISCGSQHMCSILSTGDMKCLGYNNYGQIGIGSTKPIIGSTTGFVGDAIPIVNVGEDLKVLAVANGYGHTCVKITNGLVKCFGLNSYGQLGQDNTVNIGTTSLPMGDNLPFVNLGTGVTVDSIISGSESYHTCAIISLPAGSAQRYKCWGLNSQYQLGYNDQNNRGDQSNEMGDNLPLVDIGAESRVKQLALGSGFTCALLINNVLKCYGYAEHGQLGLGSTRPVRPISDSIPSVPVDLRAKVGIVAAGAFHTCIVYTDYLRMKCLGANVYGQLGQGDDLQKGDFLTNTLPKFPAINLGTGALKIQSLQLGASTTCAIFVDSTVKCFGDNTAGQCAAGGIPYIGDEVSDMGTNLRFAMLFSTISTKTPSNAPTFKPTRVPTKAPTKSPAQPTKSPTKNPTLKCSYKTSATCNADKSCMWKVTRNVGKCYVLDCSLLSKTQCINLNKKCRWNIIDNECEPRLT